MGRYRKIDVRIWSDEKFRTLSDNAKLVVLFILTHPHMTSLGAMRATIDGLAAELGWTKEVCQKAFAEPFRKGLLEHDEEAGFVGVPNFLKYNPPENPNVVKSWESLIDLIPECELRIRLFQRVCASIDAMSEGFQKALPKGFREPFRKGMPKPEPEPEPEPESNSSSVGADLLAQEREFIQAWNDTSGVRTNRGTTLTEKRRKAFRARLKDSSWDWRAALEHFPLKCFDQPDGWRPDVEWFLKPDSVTQILEGRFDWRKETTNGRKSKAAVRGKQAQDDFAHLA